VEVYDATSKIWKPAASKEVGPPRSTEQDADFKLIIPRSVMDKISWWMHRTDKEVSGFGSLEYDEKNKTFKVKDAILLKQKVTATSAEVDGNAMARAMFRMKDDPNGLKWHWHSHVNMGVFWSMDDMEIIRSLGQRGWILATVFNYKDERRTAYLTQTTIPTANGSMSHDLFIDEIPTSVINYVPKDIHAIWDKEYDDNVTENVYTYTPGPTPYQQKQMDLLEGSIDPEEKELVDDMPLALGYNDEGVIHTETLGYVYNPCWDRTLKTHKDKLREVAYITPEEIEWLKVNSPTFERLYEQYIVAAANDRDFEFPDPHENYHGE
jgi:hypothetical protein